MTVNIADLKTKIERVSYLLRWHENQLHVDEGFREQDVQAEVDKLAAELKALKAQLAALSGGDQ